MALTVVLSVGLDPQLLETRNLVLQSAGYIFVSAYSIKEAVERFQQGDFDLVLLCHSVPAKEKDHLFCWIRASGSRIPVVCVSGNPCPGDVVVGVTVSNEPGALLRGIREALIKPEKRAAETAAFRDKQEVTAAQGKEPPAASGHEQPQKLPRAVSSLLAARVDQFWKP